MDRELPVYADWIIILGVCFFTFFAFNHLLPADLMEARNLATAQEMVRTGNYLLPTMNGEPRLEKPPLPTWIAAGVEHLLPDNLPAQRSMAGLSATLMVLFLFRLVHRLTRERSLALIAAVVLATSYNVVMMGRTATWDIFCHSFMLGAIYFLVSAFEGKGAQWLRFSLAGVFMGLSFLSKGPVSFYALLVPFLISYIFVMRPEIKGKIAPVGVMVVTGLVLSCWWPVYVAAFQPEAGMAVAGKESTAWLNHNIRPPWYYWQFPAEAGVWALFWVTSLIYFFWKKKTGLRQVFRFSVFWTVSAFVLLSLIPEKKTRYLLPMVIPGAVNIAFYLWYSAKMLLDKGERAVFRINGSFVLLIVAGMPAVLYYVAGKQGNPDWLVLLLLIAESLVFIALAVYLATGLFGRNGLSPLTVLTGTVLTMLAFQIFCLVPVSELFLNDQRLSIHTLRNIPQVQKLPFYHDQREFLRMELVYEVNRNIRPLDVENDSLVHASLPFVLVSTDPASKVLEGKNIQITPIGTFDNNWRKPDSKRYNLELVKEVSVIRAIDTCYYQMDFDLPGVK